MIKTLKWPKKLNSNYSNYWW